MPVLDPYQLEGARWLASVKRGLLADPPGLGKSAQAVVPCDLVGAKTVVVVCQGGRRAGWRDDFTMWSPKRIVHLIEKNTDLPILNVVNVVSYGMAGIIAKYLEIMSGVIDVLIIDELQALKSPSAVRSSKVLGKGGLAYYARRVYCLTGTPMLSHPGEMWTWLYTLFPEAIDFLDYDAFVQKYCVVHWTPWGDKIIGGKNLDELRKRLWPIMLRRDESVVKLPAVTFGSMEIARERVENLQELLNAENGPGGEAMITALDSGIAPVESAPLASLRRVVGMAKVGPFADDLAAELAADPLKKIGVFAYHTDVIEALRAKLAARGYHFVVIQGATSLKDREKRKLQFVSDPNVRGMIGQIQATGTGIDGFQHAAHDVVILEPDWVPATNWQAICRFRRRGQERDCTARFVSLAGSLDQRMANSARQKTELFSAIFG